MQPPSSILVLGAGELGTQVLHSLTTHPSLSSTKTKITLLLRPSTLSSTNPTKQAELSSYRSSNISLLSGDISTATEAHLTTLFTPFGTIITCTGMSLPPGTQLKITRAILAAASTKGSSVRRYFPWQFGVDYDAIGLASAQDLFDEQLAVRELLRSQREVQWVVVSTGMFMSFLFEEAFGVVDLRGGRVSALGGWENCLTVTAVEDIGRVVAELALVGIEERGVVFVAGDTVSMRRLADVVDGLLGGREVERSVKTVEQLERELLDSPDDVMRKYRAVFAAGVGVSWDKEATFNAKRGMEMVLVEDWARKNVKVPQA
ncbi:hypothetical protein Q7P35_004072 [Cladosporium inversicolor]